MDQNQIVEALLAAARGVVAARYPEQVGPLWAGLEPSLRGAAERMVAQAIEARPMLQRAVDLLPQRRAVAVAAMKKKRELAEKEWNERIASENPPSSVASPAFSGEVVRQATEKLNIAMNEYRKGVADLEEELKRGADLPTRPSVEIPLDVLERGGSKMDGFGQEAQIYAKDGKGLMRFRGELRAVPFESDAGRRFEEEAIKRARLVEAYLMLGEAYFLLPYEQESIEAADRGEKNAELPAREAKDNAKRRAAKAVKPQPQPQAQPQPQPQAQAKPQPLTFRDWRISSFPYANAAVLVRNKPGDAFSEDQYQALLSWASANEIRMEPSRSKSGTVANIKATFSAEQNKIMEKKNLLEKSSAAGLKREKEEAESKRRSQDSAQKEREKEAAAQARESRAWILANVPAINAHNSIALSDYLERKSDRFDGLVNWRWKEMLERVGAVRSDGKILWAAVRDAYEKRI